MNISISPLLATISTGLIEDGIAEQILKERKQELIKRNLIINEMLNMFVLESQITSPMRCIRLPNHFTGESFEVCARQAGVQVYGAERFSVGNKPAEKFIRISVITPPTIKILEDGINCLKKILQ